MGKRTVQYEKSNDRPDAVKLEMRAAELVFNYGRTCTQAECDGYAAHLTGADVKTRSGWAGWLEREIITHEDQREAELLAAIASAPPRQLGDPQWQGKAHAKCDEVDAERANDVCMIGADMGAPSLDALATHAEVERTFRAEHSDDEVTEVGVAAEPVDDRFDRTDGGL